jgi:hypothetical protein
MDLEGGNDNMNTDNQFRQALYGAEQSIKDKTHEEGFIISSNGDVINHTIGGKSNVSPPVRLVKNNVFTHNHPSGTCSLSLNDIRAIIRTDGQELRVVTSDGRFASLSRPKTGWNINLTEDMEKAGLGKSKLFLQADGIAISRYGHGNYSKAQVMEIGENLINDWLRTNANNYDAVFREGLI